MMNRTCCAAALMIVLSSLYGCGSSSDQYPPSVPTGVQAAAVSSDSVQLNWTESQDDLVMMGYRVYRDGSRVGSTPLTSYTDTGLTPGTSYGYRVSAFDWIGNESAKSTTLFVATADGSAPSAPGSLQGTAVSTSRIDLAWTASTDNVGVTGYRIYRNGAVIGTTTGTSYSDTGLSEYTTYTYRVAAYDAEGNESSLSSPLSATTVDATPPSVPSNLQGTAASTSRIDLTWSASTDNAGVTGYRVYRNGSLVASPAGTSYSDTGLAEATSYSYRVAAYDDEGNVSSQCGAVAVYTADATAPSVPSNLQGTAASTSQINLTWTASSDNLGVTGYRVYRNGSLVATPAGTSYNDTGLSEATSYSYRVLAYDATGNESAQCGAVAVSTADATAPSVPSNLQGTAVSTSRIDLAWTASTDNVGVTGYRVYRNGSLVASPAGTSYSDTGLSEATSYSYRVLAYDAGGNESAQCGAAAVSTADATAPSVPTNLQGTGASASQVNLTWTASTDNVGVTGYRVYRNGSLVASPAGTSYSDTGLSEVTSYSYTVAAYDAAGNASAQCGAVAVSTLDATAPSVPTNLQATVVSTSRIDLSWTASTDNVAVTGYRVYRDGSLVASPSGTSYSDTGLSAGTTYAYRVAAADAAGNVSAQCTAVNATTQSGSWGGTVLIGTASTDRGHGVAVDSSGNIYVAGYTAGALDGETNSGGNDIYLTKYDASGARQWTRLSGTAGGDESGWAAVAVYGTDSIYVTGYTSGALDGETSAGGSDIFLMKYNSSGTKQWTRLLGTASDDVGWGVAVDGSGNVYVAGTTEGNLDGQTHSGGTYDTFLTKYNASGTKQWTRLLGNGTETYAYTVAVDGSGNALVAGHTRGTFDSESNAGMLDVYVAKYNSSGTRQWVRMLGSARFDYCYGVGADTSDNVYISGAAYGDFDGLANSDGTWMSEDVFVAKFNSSGTKQWSRFFGTATNDVASGLAVDGSGNVYITGNSDGALDGEINAGGHDLFLVKYNTSGTRQWTRLLGTASGEYGRSVAVDGSGNAYLTGHTSGNLDGATNNGGNDAYLVKYDTSGNLQ
jgi:chitodextrinase